MRTRLAVALGLALMGCACGLSVAEGALRIAGFSFHTFPTVQFGWPEPKAIADVYVPDRDLFWVPRDYAQKLAAARTVREAVVFLGDSCTEFGTYPRLTLERLQHTAPDLARGVKLGVGGWSSVQGLAQVKRDVVGLGARVVTLYFGWNDHWVALGAPDAEAEPGALTWWLSQHLRLYELLVKARLGARGTSLEGRPNRVPLPRYEFNLREMSRLLRESGSRVVFITAPTAHQRGQEPAYLAQRHLRRLDELVPLHAEYVEGTRRAARASSAVLCDAAAQFDQLPGPRTRYFVKDRIHLSDEGNARLADMLASCIIDASTAR